VDSRRVAGGGGVSIGASDPEHRRSSNLQPETETSHDLPPFPVAEATTPLPSGITLELVFEPGHTANLARREADMALRHQPPETGDFYISKAGTFACAVYRRRGADAGAWVTCAEEQAHYAPARWVQRQVAETRRPVALRASSMLMHLEAIRAGTGRGVLPCYVGDGHPLLERLTPPIPEIAAEYWIIVHRDLRRAACVRAVIDWVKALFAEHRDVLAGIV